MLLRMGLVLLSCVVINVDNARILGIFHVPSFSHNIAGKTLLKALAGRGHQVTMISPFPLKTPIKNYEDIYVEEVTKFKEDGAVRMMIEAENASMFSKVTVMQDVMTKMHEICLNHTLVQDLLISGETFDLVIMEWVVNEGMLDIAHHFKAPVIMVSSVGSSPLTNKITANPAPPAFVPNFYPVSIDEMTFLERVANTLTSLFFELYMSFSYQPIQERMLQQYFPDAPPLQELIRNVSLIFLNSHFSIESPRPYVPSMVQIGGIHLEEPRELPKDLKKFMDEATEGVLYFSLGGNAKSSDLSAEKIEAIIRVFRKLPVKVLWKFETNDISNLPSNVRTGKWLPQTDILAHRNLKIFVTHGGLLSITEAIFRGVPMVGMPCFADQMANVKNSVHHGYSTMVTLDELTEETFSNAIMEVLNNPKYRESVRKRSLWFRDQPFKPLDKAIFWVEYVLRHRGASHLQTAALKLSWYQYYVLDVLGFILGIFLVVCMGCFLILRVIVKVLKNIFIRKSKVD